MKTTILKQADRVWLDGVNGWFVGDRESSVHAAEAAIMEALGEDISYSELVGVSGLAFRMQVSKNGLCPSSPHASCGYQCVERSVLALPYKLQMYEAKADDAEEVQLVRKAVIKSIDRGIPVQYGSEEDGLIIGYQKQGQEWICFHPLREGGKKSFVELKWPWGVAVYAERKPNVPPKYELAVGALNQALEMAELPDCGEYHLGWAAWDAYISKLNDLQRQDEKTVRENMTGNAWIYECLVQFRREAAKYLRSVSEEFSSHITQYLADAADIYNKMTEKILTDSECCILSVAPYPWSLKKGENWTMDMRENQISRLEKAVSLEREAIHHIKLALAKLT